MKDIDNKKKPKKERKGRRRKHEYRSMKRSIEHKIT